MIETPVRSSPAMIARSIGAAPRQRGSSDGCTLRISCEDSSGSLMSAPKAHTTTTGRAAGAAARAAARAARAISSSESGRVDVGGLLERQPERPGGLGHRGRRSRRPRPAGRSGRVITSAGRCAPAASRSSTAAANCEVPMKTVAKPAGSARR